MKKNVIYRCVKCNLNSRYEFDIDNNRYAIIPESDGWRLIINGNRTSYTRGRLKSMLEFVERNYDIKLVKNELNNNN